MAGHFDPAVSRQLRQLALEQDTTVQGLLAEALNDLFEKYGKKPIA
ncbi:ribbon-helix-helix domain-containing protein [Mastigocladopsis repens]